MIELIDLLRELNSVVSEHLNFIDDRCRSACDKIKIKLDQLEAEYIPEPSDYGLGPLLNPDFTDLEEYEWFSVAQLSYLEDNWLKVKKDMASNFAEELSHQLHESCKLVLRKGGLL